MRKQRKQPVTFRGTYFFFAVCTLYILLFLVNGPSAQAALLKSGRILVRILPVIGIVIFCTALINYFLQPGQIAAHLGRKSGWKGWLWALAAGVISHGPMYAWYPLLEDVRRQGMEDKFIVIFFASRAIKLPLLPMMIDYFGPAFTVVLSFYILIGALLQGWVFELTEKRTTAAR